MREWNELTGQEQIYMYWGYIESTDESISFSEYDEMMQGFIFE